MFLIAFLVALVFPPIFPPPPPVCDPITGECVAYQYDPEGPSRKMPGRKN